MGIFDFLVGIDINEGWALYNANADAVLLDVRTQREYERGHIPKSKNIALQELQRAESEIPDKGTPIYVYCQSGSRSRNAAATLEEMGYINVTDIGGISGYRGEQEGKKKGVGLC